MQITGTLVLIIFCSLLGGIWLDKKLGTTPWLMLVLMVVGLVFAMYTVIRIAIEAQQK
jgi:F0F1-type ATP synthase assembly protein I